VPTTVAQIAEAVRAEVEEQTGRDAGIEHLAMRPGETPGVTVLADQDDVRPLADPLSFVPLADGLKSTVAHYREIFA
jgi:hypothetical protein